MRKYFFVLLILNSSCEHISSRNPNSENPAPPPADMQIDDKFEFFEGGSFDSEKMIHDKLIITSKQLMQTMHQDANKTTNGYSPMTRDAHAKSHGCLKAKFTVQFPNENSFLKDHKSGIFSEDKSYSAWVRFSNNDHLPMRRDNEYDLRGISIKLMGVKGQKIMSGYEDAPTQDFLMYGSKTFFVANNQDYVGFIEGLRDNNAAFRLLTEQPIAAIKTRKAQWAIRNHINPLTISYFSATPIRLGHPQDPHRQAIKYGVVPCKNNTYISLKDKKSTHYMRENLKSTLKLYSACFEFQIQLRADPSRMPIEDATVAWPEQEQDYGSLPYSPYITVAKLEIPQQNFDTHERDAYCENLSFTPWHALIEHKPLGRTMRMRRDLYRATSEYRRSSNNTPIVEPLDFEID